MSDLKVTHCGYVIEFREHSDEWSCDALEISNVKLSAVRARINEINRSERKVKVQAWHIGRSRSDSACGTLVTITVLCEPEEARSYRKAGTNKCWVSDGRSRWKMSIADLIPLDRKADFDVWLALEDAADTAREKADAALETIPRLDADSIMLASKEAAASDVGKTRPPRKAAK